MNSDVFVSKIPLPSAPDNIPIGKVKNNEDKME